MGGDRTGEVSAGTLRSHPSGGSGRLLLSLATLLPSGSEQNEVLRVVSIPSRILLYCRQSSRLFISLVEALLL